ncbi:MAG: hypothetical protein JKX78_11660 [Alteromonadaceae bacterium]|nr:hypothetical protein [Alteromonadaceae bacterium]
MKNLILMLCFIYMTIIIAPFAYAKNNDTESQVKQVNSKIIRLSDSTGLVYVGAEIAPADVAIYLKQLKNKLGEQQFKLFRSNQIARDQQGFHVTLINPFEYKKLINNKQKVTLGQTIAITLQGLGKVATTVVNVASHASKQDNTQSYFVIVSSFEGEKFRQHYGLKAKDFHATLGFNPHDIYTLSKGIERLVK